MARRDVRPTITALGQLASRPCCTGPACRPAGHATASCQPPVCGCKGRRSRRCHPPPPSKNTWPRRAIARRHRDGGGQSGEPACGTDQGCTHRYPSTAPANSSGPGPPCDASDGAWRLTRSQGQGPPSGRAAHRCLGPGPAAGTVRTDTIGSAEEGRARRAATLLYSLSCRASSGLAPPPRVARRPGTPGPPQAPPREAPGAGGIRPAQLKAPGSCHSLPGR